MNILKPPGNAVALCAVLFACLGVSGCGSLANEGAATGAGVAGAAIAGTITSNAAVASGIGLGALAGAQTGVKYVEKNAHRSEQDAIAAAAGPLAAGGVALWDSHHVVKLEPDEHGRVTVSRLISVTGGLECKEIVFSVESIVRHIKAVAQMEAPVQTDVIDYGLPNQQSYTEHAVSAFYVATICRDGDQWRWASAEPATERWGALQ